MAARIGEAVARCGGRAAGGAVRGGGRRCRRTRSDRSNRGGYGEARPRPAMAGDDSPGFARTGRMLASWARAAYGRIKPDEAYRCSAQAGDAKHGDRPRSFDVVRTSIKPHAEPRGLADRVDGVIGLANKGAHPSPGLLGRTVGVRPGRFVVGPNNERDVAAGAFCFGVSAMSLLLSEVMVYVDDREAWADESAAAYRNLISWLDASPGKAPPVGEGA